METELKKPNNRAKLYLLDDENEWLDQGTGFPQIDSSSRKSNVFMRFFSEDSGREIYGFEINENIVFERKEDKIISWYNEKTNLDMALSFQTQAGADLIWGAIEDAKEIAKSNLIQLMRTESVDSSGLNYDPFENDIFSDESVLSMPSLNNLQKILNELTSANTIEKKVQISSLLTTKRVYLSRLAEIFQDLEHANDLQNLSLLQLILKLIKGTAQFRWPSTSSLTC